MRLHHLKHRSKTSAEACALLACEIIRFSLGQATGKHQADEQTRQDAIQFFESSKFARWCAYLGLDAEMFRHHLATKINE